MKEKGVLTSKPSDRVVAISFDEKTADLFREMRDDLGVSQSKLVREALKFYSKHKTLFDSVEEDILYTYVEMLRAGEHIILDIDHWILLLNFIESHPEKEKFWKMHRKISRSHAEEFRSRNYDTDFILKRLEVCNFFKLSKNTDSSFILIPGYDAPKSFLQLELEEILSDMEIPADIKEELSKLRVNLLPNP